MNESTFWSLIDDAKSSANDDKHMRHVLVGLLTALPEADIFDFSDFFCRYRDVADSWQLWDAIYLINGGCSDDSWFDFRDYLVSRGQAVYERTIADPESLLLDDLDEYGHWKYGEYHYHLAAVKAYQIQLGRTDDCDIEIPTKHKAVGTTGKGIHTESDSEVKKHFPRIWEWKQQAKNAG